MKLRHLGLASLVTAAFLASSMAEASVLQFKFSQDGDPSTIVHLTEHHPSNQGRARGFYQFYGELDVGAYTITSIHVFGKTPLIVGQQLTLSVDAFTNDPGQHTLSIEAFVTDFTVTKGLPPGTVFEKSIRQRIGSFHPSSGNSPTQLSYSSWINLSNDPLDRGTLIAEQTADATDYTGPGYYRTFAFETVRPIDFVEGDPFAFVQEMSVTTSGPTEFFAHFGTWVIPAPAPVFLFSSLIAAAALVSSRRK